MTMQFAIQADQLRKVYPKKGGNPPVVALDSLSFTVLPGEIYGLLGLNGAGKSTAVKILTTLITPTSGKAQALGLDPVLQGDELRPSIGLVAQSVSLNEYATVAENFRLFGNRYPPCTILHRRRNEATCPTIRNRIVSEPQSE